MESKDRLLFEISELLTKAFDKSISGEEFDRLQHLISTDPKALECYFDIISTYSCLDGIKKFDFGDNVTDHDDQFDLTASAGIDSKVDDSNTSLRGVDVEGFMADVDRGDSEDSEEAREILEILELARTSPAVEIEKPKPVKEKPELIQKVVHQPSEKRKLTKFQKFVFAFAACFLGFLIYIGNAPQPIPLPVVAYLYDSINAEWDDELQMPDEYGEMVQSRYRLKKGYASILFNGGAKVTVEAPAELSLDSPSAMELFSGRIYSIVPNRAKGFAVTTTSSKIVDLGTEFGVEVDSSGNTQLHVIKGRIVLFAGLLSGEKTEVNVNAGEAKKVYNDGLVTDILAGKQKFARRIYSKSNLVLRNQKFNLADVIGGGNGFGTGTLEKGIDMIATRFKIFENKDINGLEIKDFSYRRFAEHPYIDGVCVPNGGKGPVEVSSKGHIFENCPQSQGIIGSGVFNGAFHFSGLKGIPKTQSSLGGTTYGTVTNPAIYITPNQAVTFDLDAIRKDLGGVSISGFSSKAGLSDVLLKYSQGLNPKTSFYVLVDGVVRFYKIDQQVTDEVLDVRVDIGPDDRFLTLITLQGTDGRTDFEYSLFAKPSLTLE